MLTINGEKIEAGHGFATKSGMVPFIVLTIHRDDTVTFVSQAHSYRIQSGLITARSGDTLRVSFERFKEIYKEPLETVYDREEKEKAREIALREHEYQRNKDHEEALRMDLLLRASRGEDIMALSNELEAMIYEIISDYSGY
ncbi:MAG: hypothetical protein H9W81_13430 [Enterococcus sp.]|nr:hypothetical protein [Enterococcus sp.]